MYKKLISTSVVILVIIGSFGVIGSRVNKNDDLIGRDSDNLGGEKTLHLQALNIGVNHNLQYCDEDARALNRLLIESGWSEDYCELRSDNPADGNTNVNVGDIKNKLNDMADNSDEYTTSLFSFSGHGGEEGDGTSHICLKDGNLNANTLSNILDNFYGDVVCIFDCCHAGGMKGSFTTEDVDLYVSNFINTVGSFGENNKNTNRVILMACALEETSWEVRDLNYSDEDKGAGLWTYFVWHGLNGHADTSDGEITAEEAFDYAQPKAHKYSIDNGGNINPQISEDGPDEIVIIGDRPIDGEAEVTLTMLQISQIDEIDPIPFDQADWYYTAKLCAGNAAYTKTKYSSSAIDNWKFNHDHKMEIDEPEVSIEITVKDDDIFDFWLFQDDLADISSRPGPRADEVDDEKWRDDEWFRDEGSYDGAVYHGIYNVITGELTGDNLNKDGDNYITRGDLEPDGSTDKDTNDAKVKFKITDTFNVYDYKPKINDEINDINMNDAEKDIYYKTINIENLAPLHNWAEHLPKLEWDADITKGSSWLSIESDDNGEIPVGESSNIKLKIDTEDWNRGETKTGTVSISSNDEYGNDDIDVDVKVSVKKVKSRQISNPLFEIIRTIFPKLPLFHLFFNN